MQKQQTSSPSDQITRVITVLTCPQSTHTHTHTHTHSLISQHWGLVYISRVSGRVRADSHIPCCSHAVPLLFPCHLKDGSTHTMPFPCRSPAIHTGHWIWDWYASDNKLPGTGRGSSKGHKLASREHAVTCHHPAMALRGCLQKGTLVAWQGNGIGAAWERHGNGMSCVNQTRPHYVNQMGNTQSNDLAERHGRGTAGERHESGMVCVNPP
jgi:hypothetical protein